MLNIEKLGLQSSYLKHLKVSFHISSNSSIMAKKKVNFLKAAKERNLNNPCVSPMAL